MRARLRSPGLWLVALIFFWEAAAAAQTLTSASVTGTVRDASASVVPGATVEIRNRETNQIQQAVTDQKGRFRLLYLPVGSYDLVVRSIGFTDARATLTLAVGDQPDVPVVLTPAAVSESVRVEAPEPLIEARRTEVAGRVTPLEIDTLPLNGRNYLDLATLAPNVSRTNLRSTDRFAETSAVPGTGISVAGQRNLGNSFIIDGLSANDDAADLAGTFLSEEVIREFQVITSGGVAEFGRASSGTVSVVTKSGTNQATGRAYEFFRDDALDARNALSPRKEPASGKPLKDPLRQNQYGLSGGGPITKDRTFWFGSVEVTNLSRTGIVTIAPAAIDAINTVLDAAQDAGPRIRTGNYATGYDTANLFGRADHQLTGGSRLQLRYSLYDLNGDNARTIGGLSDVSRGTAIRNTDQTIAVNLLSTWSSGTIHEVRAQVSRSRLDAPINDDKGPAVNISGVANFGTSTSSPTGRDLDLVEIADAVTWQRGAHVIKAGGDWLYNRVNITFPGALQGVYTFTSLSNFQRGVYSTFQQAFGAPSQFQSNPNLGLFAQDEWRPRADLTINAGIRYDLQWLPDPILLDTNNVAPRLGAAFAPASGKTVIRAAAGIYFDRVPLRATSNALQRDGTKYRVAQISFGQTGAPAFPAVLGSFPAGVLISTTTINPDIQNGRSTQASVEVERAISGRISASAGYHRLRGRNIIMQRNVNVPTLTAAEAAVRDVSSLGRPNPDFGNINEYDGLGESWFDGLTVSAILRTSPWGRARVSYTLSKAVDDVGNTFFNTPQDNFHILGDKGASDNDQRHRLVANGTIGDGTSRTIRRALGGMQIGYVFSYATAAPFNVQTGGDRNNDTTINDRPEGVPRNSARLPCFSDLTASCGTASFDLRVSRAFVFGGHHRLEVLAEAFNLLNHVNVVNVNNIIGTGQAPNPTFKQVTALGDMRQMQLGARWTF